MNGAHSNDIPGCETSPQVPPSRRERQLIVCRPIWIASSFGVRVLLQPLDRDLLDLALGRVTGQNYYQL
jgi:hypothetical protein